MFHVSCDWEESPILKRESRPDLATLMYNLHVTCIGEPSGNHGDEQDLCVFGAQP
ncbi:hypothetical protein PAXRUDRAFT_823339 [Paxillus rubicundulus Ve08.2h10]|uniref:Uncharacterized protein n=1 Tax=Paxillus rubicundulus Ve08.2h10 TaxID=930991 RepID=A0A0D0DVK7_9AGAM|nr:hypothetical protein PAXRUDRAFT_823339 [Paxillus rubicundulus Ve08.2h10]